MAPTADQIAAAAKNHRQPPVTPGARLYAALAHARLSQKSETPLAGGVSGSSRQMIVTGSTDAE